jgi:hypothetical protein
MSLLVFVALIAIIYLLYSRKKRWSFKVDPLGLVIIIELAQFVLRATYDVFKEFFSQLTKKARTGGYSRKLLLEKPEVTLI